MEGKFKVEGEEDLMVGGGSLGSEFGRWNIQILIFGLFFPSLELLFGGDSVWWWMWFYR